MTAHSLYTTAELRAIEQATAAALGPDTLMRRAGQACAESALTMLATRALRSLQEDALDVLVLAGPGNNGGDALEAALRLGQTGLTVTVLLLGDAQRLPPEALRAFERASAEKIDIRPWPAADAAFLPVPALVIDGLFGIGLSRPLEGDLRAMLERIAALDRPVLAIDIPSGLQADTGSIVGGKDGYALRATHTITLIADKPGLHTGDGVDYCGAIEVHQLGLDLRRFPAPRAFLNSLDDAAAQWPARRLNSHKGSYGDVIVIGGAEGMSGAPILAARTALHAGAGKVFAAFAGAAPGFDAAHPELMCRDAHTMDFGDSTLVVGPGLGTSRSSADLLARALNARGALVIDADALNLIAAEPGLQAKLAARRGPAILTPHPLEAARLLACDVAEVQHDRLHAARELARRFKAVAILKGAGSVIAAGDEAVAINPTGNPGLATAGTGDVLSGLCGALLAQHLDAPAAAQAAVWLHGAAADWLVENGTGPVGLTASELPAAIRKVINRYLAA